MNSKNTIKTAGLLIGQPAPPFEGIDQDGKNVSLSDFQGKKLILFFYPADGTPTCTNEVCNLRDHYTTLQRAGYQLLGVSPDNMAKHQKFIAKHKLPFPLLADTNHATLKAYHAWGPKQLFGKKYEGVIRTTVVIDENGYIAKVIHPVKASTHAAQILAD